MFYQVPEDFGIHRNASCQKGVFSTFGSTISQVLAFRSEFDKRFCLPVCRRGTANDRGLVLA